MNCDRTVLDGRWEFANLVLGAEIKGDLCNRMLFGDEMLCCFRG